MAVTSGSKSSCRIAFASDFHLELRSSQPVPDATGLRHRADVVVLAGDIAKAVKAIDAAAMIAEAAELPVVFVAGNHEYYGGRYPKVLSAMRDEAQLRGVSFLENNRIDLTPPSERMVRFLGATLWTDWTLRGRPKAAIDEARRRMNDYRYIRAGDGTSYQRFLPQDASRLHFDSFTFIESELAQDFDGPTVVVTHHAPSARSLPPAPPALIDAANASPLDRLLMGEDAPDLWIHGHTHHRVDWRAGPNAGGTRVVSNPRGYMSEGRTFSWQIVEI
jgi:predicted phosphodiesterase